MFAVVLRVPNLRPVRVQNIVVLDRHDACAWRGGQPFGERVEITGK